MCVCFPLLLKESLSFDSFEDVCACLLSLVALFRFIPLTFSFYVPSLFSAFPFFHIFFFLSPAPSPCAGRAAAGGRARAVAPAANRRGRARRAAAGAVGGRGRRRTGAGTVPYTQRVDAREVISCASYQSTCRGSCCWKYFNRKCCEAARVCATSCLLRKYFPSLCCVELFSIVRFAVSQFVPSHAHLLPIVLSQFATSHAHLLCPHTLGHTRAGPRPGRVVRDRRAGRAGRRHSPPAGGRRRADSEPGAQTPS